MRATVALAIAFGLLAITLFASELAADRSSATGRAGTQQHTGVDRQLRSTPANATSVTVKVDERAGRMMLTTDRAMAKGPITFIVRNRGSIPHELVILKTGTPHGDLAVTDSRVDEDISVGNITGVASGSSKSASFDLDPGTYVLVCNIPGHYRAGMHAALTVT